MVVYYKLTAPAPFGIGRPSFYQEEYELTAYSDEELADQERELLRCFVLRNNVSYGMVQMEKEIEDEDNYDAEEYEDDDD